MGAGLLLKDAVARQLDGVIGWAGLPGPIAHAVRLAFTGLTEGALGRPAAPPFTGLSRINANGLPFQWSFSLGPDSERSVRFLCEAGQPGQSAIERLAVSRTCLAGTIGALGCTMPAWLDPCVFKHVLPDADTWPGHWRSALWFGVGATHKGLLIKPYVNLNRGTALERWRRLGTVLAALGRDADLATLCALSRAVSRDSWPVGLAVDVLPDGACGRLKIYFRSSAVCTGWLARWYAATNGLAHARAVRCALDALPFCGAGRYPEHAFIVGLELHGGAVSLKTDFAITRWMPSDAAIGAGVELLLRGIGADPATFGQALEAIGGKSLCPRTARLLRFVGLGHEPDGREHVNVYVEPPLPDDVAAVAVVAAPRRSNGGGAALQAALAFLWTAQRDGGWQDFALPVGVSDQWVTAYVLWKLGEVPPGLLDAAARRHIGIACEALYALGAAAGGWGYNGGTPRDADSTSLALLALRAHGFKLPEGAAEFVAACQTAQGGVATYPAGSEPGGSWTDAVCDVTAVALMAALRGLPAGRATAYLAQSRLDDGSWPTFWWHTRLYPTHLALAASDDASKTARLATTLNAHQPIGAFETALLLDCCKQLGLKQRCAQWTRALLEQQREDGAWAPSALLRLTHPGVAAPADSIDAGPSFIDQNGVFTTATVMAALARPIYLRPAPGA
jgi:hypothetical protein